MKLKLKKLRLPVMLLALAVSISSCAKKEAGSCCADEWYFEVENASEFKNVVEVKLMVYERDSIRAVGSYGSTFTTNLYIALARSEWKDNGFTIEFPKTLASNYLYPLIRGDAIAPPITRIPKQPTTTISNGNVKVTTAYFVGYDKDGNVVAVFSPANIDKNGNTQTATFTYVNSDVSISGYSKAGGHAMPIYPDGPSAFETTTNYSVKWKKGWNVWSLSRTHTVEGYTAITTEQWTTTPVSELKWYGSEENLHIFQN